MKPFDILSGALKRLSRKGGWTRLTMAKTADGTSTLSYAPDAVCWCSAGAINAATPLTEIATDVRGRARSLLAAAAGLHGPSYITLWNDHSKKSEILAAFRRARDNAIALGE